jgi:hypothetical protein
MKFETIDYFCFGLLFIIFSFFSQQKGNSILTEEEVVAQSANQVIQEERHYNK